MTIFMVTVVVLVTRLFSLSCLLAWWGCLPGGIWRSWRRLLIFWQLFSLHLNIEMINEPLLLLQDLRFQLSFSYVVSFLLLLFSSFQFYLVSHEEWWWYEMWYHFKVESEWVIQWATHWMNEHGWWSKMETKHNYKVKDKTLGV